MKKLFRVLIAALLLCALTVNALAAVLILPQKLTVIEEEAFYNDDSLEAVVLPDGIEAIESKAFAYSTLSRINLPSSLTYIADNALLGCSNLKTVTATKGSYAYEWAVINGYITDPVRLSATADTKTIITDETRPSGTVTVSGGLPPYSMFYEWYADGYEYPQQSEILNNLSEGIPYEWEFEPCSNSSGSFHVLFTCYDSLGNEDQFTLSGFEMVYESEPDPDPDPEPTPNPEPDPVPELVPAKPTGLSVAVLGCTELEATWDAVEGAAYYNVYYSQTTSSDSFELYTTVSASQTSCVLENLDIDQKYYVKVSAVSAIGWEGDKCSYKYATTNELEAPTLSIAGKTFTSVTLKWTAVEEAAGYIVYKSTSNTSSKFQECARTNNNTTTYTVEKLPSDDTYYFKVAAYAKTDAEGTKSSSKSATLSLPSNPSGFTVTADQNNIGKVTLAWTAIDGVEGYNIYRSTSTTSSTFTLIDSVVGASVSSYSMSGLTPGQKYFFKVAAYVDTDEEGTRTTYKSVTIPEAVTQPDPEPYIDITLNKSSMELEVGDTYTLKCTVDTNTTTRSPEWTSSNASVATVSSSGVVTAKSAGTATITCEVSGNGVSDTATCKVTVVAEPEPEDITVNIYESAVTLTEGEEYTLDYDVDATGAYSEKWSSSNAGVATVSPAGKVTAVSAGTATITLKATLTSDSSVYDSDTCKITVIEDGPSVPDAPTQKTPTVDGNTITVSWSSVTGATEYTVYYGKSSSIDNAKAVDAGTKTSKTLTGLEYDTRYYLWVTASNSAGESDASARKYATTDEAIVEFSVIHPTTPPTDVLSKGYFELSKDAGVGEKSTWQISSSHDWTITKSGDTGWYSLSQTSGAAGDTEIKIELREKPAAGESFESTLTFNVNGNTYPIDISITIPTKAPTVSIKYDGKTYTGTNSTTVATVSNDGNSSLWFDFNFADAHTIKFQILDGNNSPIYFITANAKVNGGSESTHWTDSKVSGATTGALQFYILKNTVVGTYTAKITATGNGGTATASVKITVVGNTSDGSYRQNVVNYAEKIQEDEWTLSSGYILLYYNAYNPSYSNGAFTMGTPYIARGTIRGIPYTLSSNNTGGGAEKTYANYMNLSVANKTALSEIYTYDGGNRISMKYGMSCATFVTDCLLRGFPNKSLSTYALTNIHEASSWKSLITKGGANSTAYSSLQPGDYLYKGSHVMLVVKNTGSEIVVIEQTPPDKARTGCTKLTTETITVTYNGVNYTKTAYRLCMECDSCKQHTLGTARNTYSYSSLSNSGYYAMYVDYTQQ